MNHRQKKGAEAPSSVIAGKIIRETHSGYWRVIGSAERMIEKAEELGQRWLKGIGLARWLEAR